MVKSSHVLCGLKERGTKMGKRKKCVSCSKVIYEYRDLDLDESSILPKNIGRVAVPCIYFVDDCESMMCLPCSAEEITLPSGVRVPGVCPDCELDRLEDMEKLGMYYREEGSRKIQEQLWEQAFRLAGTDTFDGMCTEAIYEHLDKMDKNSKSHE